MIANMNYRVSIILTCILFQVLLSSCLSYQSRTAFYVLNPEVETANTIHLPENTGIIGIGPLRIPKYLDRPEIVTRYNQNEVRINEFHQWAGPLKDNIVTVVEENLSLYLADQTIVRFPWKKKVGVKFQITINIQRLDVEKQLAVLSADWQIENTETHVSTQINKTNIEVPVTGDRYSNKVIGINEVINQFSREIADSFAGYLANQDVRPQPVR